MSKYHDSDLLRELVADMNDGATVTISDELRKEQERNRKQRELVERLTPRG